MAGQRIAQESIGLARVSRVGEQHRQVPDRLPVQRLAGEDRLEVGAGQRRLPAVAAQGGPPQPRGVMRGIEREHTVEGGEGFVESSLADEGRAQVVERLRGAGVDLRAALQMDDRLRDVSPIAEQRAQAVLRDGEARVGRNRQAVLAQGLLPVADLLGLGAPAQVGTRARDQIGEVIDEGIGELHLHTAGLGQVPLGLVPAAEAAKGEADAVVDDGGARLRGQDLLELDDGAGQVALGGGDAPQAEARGRDHGRIRERLLVPPPGRGAEAAVEIHLAEADERGAIAGAELQRALQARRGGVESALELGDHSQEIRPPAVVRGERRGVGQARLGAAPQVVREVHAPQRAEGGGGRGRGRLRGRDLPLQPRPQFRDLRARRLLVAREVGLGYSDEPRSPGVSAAGGQADRRRQQRGGGLHGLRVRALPFTSVV